MDVPHEEDQAETVKGGVTLTLEYYLPEDLVAHYSDNLVVTRTDTVFVLSFVQSEPPLVTSDEELRAKGKIRAKCVARILVHPNKMKAFIEVLSRQQERPR